MTTIDWALLLPALAPACASLLVLVVDLMAPRAVITHYVVALAGLVVGVAGLLAGVADTPGDVRETLCPSGGGPCFWQVTGLTTGLQLAALLAAGVALAVAAPLEPRGERARTAVSLSLLLAATTGAVGVAAARDLGSWLVTLELATLPVVALSALPATRRALAGSVQLLTTSLVSFAMLALAAACWYAATGSPSLTARAVAGVTTGAQQGLLVLATVLVLGGVGFKLSLVPFHAWTPTTYAGAPFGVATFLAGVSKIAALSALLVVVTSLVSLGKAALVATAVLAVVSMTLGNLLALRQDDVVRLLAWSTVAQAGWVVLPLVSYSTLGARAAATYVVAYVLATLPAFAVVGVVLRGTRGRSGRQLAAYRGLVRRHPFVGGLLALALTSLAGLPPGIVGVVAKVVALRPVVVQGWWVVAVVAALNAVLGVAVYLRWFRVLIAEPDVVPAAVVAGEAEEEPEAFQPVVSHRIALGVTGLLLLATSVQPQLVLGLFG